MSLIQRAAAAYGRRRAARYEEAIREQARNAAPESWQCERCALIVSAHLGECPACPTLRDHWTLMIIQGDL